MTDEELIARLREKTVKKLPNNWQKGRKCPDCGSDATRPKCFFDYGPSCARHDPDAYDPPAWEEVPDPLSSAAADRIEALVKERDDAVIKRAAWELEAKTLQARLTAAEAQIDKADVLRIVMEECYKDREMKLATRIEERLATLPARGVEVPADVKDYAIDVSEAYDTVMEVQRNPAGAWQVIQALAGHIAALAPTDAAQARETAARLLLDMLHMRNGAHEGVSKEDAQKMWDAASTREGYAAVDAFLRSIIGEART